MKGQAWRLIIEGNKVTVSGTDIVGTLHHREADILVIKVAGHETWSGIGQRRYVAAEFQVWRSVRPSNGVDVLAEQIVDFPVKAAS